MANEVEVFSIGNTVWCQTYLKHEYEGEVKAFCPKNQMLVLQCAASSGDPKLINMEFITLNNVEELKIKSDAIKHYDPPLSVNLHKLTTRIRNRVEEKKRKLQAISANVSKEGESLFLALSKIIQEVKWRNSDITIYNQEVYISPPYQLENVHGNSNSKTYDYILKVVEKHIQGRVMNSQNSQLQPNTRPAQ